MQNIVIIIIDSIYFVQIWVLGKIKIRRFIFWINRISYFDVTVGIEVSPIEFGLTHLALDAFFQDSSVIFRFLLCIIDFNRRCFIEFEEQISCISVKTLSVSFQIIMNSSKGDSDYVFHFLWIQLWYYTFPWNSYCSSLTRNDRNIILLVRFCIHIDTISCSIEHIVWWK